MLRSIRLSNYKCAKNGVLTGRVHCKNNRNEEFVITRTRFVGSENLISIRGLWHGESHEQIWTIYKNIINSFEFNTKGISNTNSKQEYTEKATPELGVNKIFKWAGIILGVLIAVGILNVFLKQS